eukprot:gene7654-15664_t
MDITELTMILESVSPMGASQKEFQVAAAAVKEMGDISQEHQLQLYGLYKQSTVGNITSTEPPIDIAQKMKWYFIFSSTVLLYTISITSNILTTRDAWNAFEGYPQQSAANAYVYLVSELQKERNQSSQGPTPNHMKDPSASFMQAVSTFQDMIGDDGSSSDWTPEEALCEAVVSQDYDRVLRCISSGADVNISTREGMTPLHFAADGGSCRMVEILLEHGAVMDVRDEEGQTPLMLAAICEHQDVVRVLLGAGADVSIANTEGVSLLTMDDLSEDIASVLSEHGK